MATLTELIADVYVATNRPDLVADTLLAVKKATLKAHHSDFFPKDAFETGIQWATPAFLQSLEYRTLVPRWRAPKFLRKYDSTGDTPGDFFTFLTPEQTLDSYSVQKEDICYVAGELIEIKSSTEDQYMLLGCYRHPDITEATFSSWIALDHPYLIVYEAAATVLKTIGKAEEATAMKQEVAEQYATLKMELALIGE
jgi:hypothetical protein